MLRLLPTVPVDLAPTRRTPLDPLAKVTEVLVASVATVTPERVAGVKVGAVVTELIWPKLVEADWSKVKAAFSFPLTNQVSNFGTGLVV